MLESNLMDISNPELRLAEEFVQHTRCHIFLTGKAGTGKTTFLQTIRKKCPKRMVVTAPTGVAAINAGGVTLHSFFQLPFGPFVPGGDPHAAPRRIRREKINILRSLDLLVIDEVSMVRADLLDSVDAVLRRYRRSDQPFGGVQLLMIGDLSQLSPVVKKQEWQFLQEYYATPYFFSSNALAHARLVPITLQHIYRQSDPDFIAMLNCVRDNRLDAEVLARLNVRYLPDFTPADSQGYITLCTHNRNADAINDARLNKLPGPSHRFVAELSGEFPEQAFPVAAELELKVGAQVMFTRNSTDAEKSYFNGKIGKVSLIRGERIEVCCPGEAGVISVEPSTWENIEYQVDPQSAEISQRVIGTFRQYPLKPAWAITIHKSQGLTFDKAVIDTQAAFAFGQVYVALSRCRNLEGIVLSAPLVPAAVKTDPVVQRFMADMAAQAPSSAFLTTARNLYQQELLLECFSFERLGLQLGRLTGLLLGNATVVQISGGGDLPAVQERVSAEICKIGERFKRQLQGLFTEDQEPAADPVILERLAKAAAYFQEKITATLTPLIESLAVETDNQELRKQITQAHKQLTEEVTRKSAGVKACGEGFRPERYLRAVSIAALEQARVKAGAGSKGATIMYSAADVGHPELFETLRRWRKDLAEAAGVPHYQIMHQKTLVQIAVHLPDTIAALLKIRGIGKILAEKYGPELTAMVADYRRAQGITQVVLPQSTAAEPTVQSKQAQKAKEDTRGTTLAMFREGLPPERIATERGLALSTIEGHLAFCVEGGELAIDLVVQAAKRRMIEDHIAAVETKSLRELKAALGEEVSYGEIKLVLAHLAYCQKEE